MDDAAVVSGLQRVHDLGSDPHGLQRFQASDASQALFERLPLERFHDHELGGSVVPPVVVEHERGVRVRQIAGDRAHHIAESGDEPRVCAQCFVEDPGRHRVRQVRGLRRPERSQAVLSDQPEQPVLPISAQPADFLSDHLGAGGGGSADPIR